MNIACDARALAGEATGVGVWTRHIVKGLVSDGRHQVFLAAPKRIRLPPELISEHIETIPPAGLPWPGTLWLNTVLPSRLGKNGVFIGSLGLLPRRCPIPGIVMLHDLTPRTHASRHTLANRFCFNAYLEESLDQAAAVVVGSLSTRDEALRIFPWLRKKIRQIGYGVDSFYKPPEKPEQGVRLRQNFTGGRPYILYLGTLEARKGLETLFKAWENLAPRKDVDLVLAGKQGWKIGGLLRMIRRSSFKSRVHLPGYLDRENTRSLMQHSELFVLPSEAEGFGLPLSEAIACGTACVASDIAALHESGGHCPLFFPPGDVNALADILDRALLPEVNAELKKRSLKRADALRWKKPVNQWRLLLEEIGENSEGLIS